MEFARAGNIAPQTVIAVSGPLNAFTHDLEPQLRKLGLPTNLERGYYSHNVYQMSLPML